MSHAETGRARIARTDDLAGYVRGVAAGDQQSLAWLYDASSPLVYGIALRMLRNPADAEEVVADVYCYVWRNPSAWEEGRGSVLGWLTMLCRSRCLDRIRSQAARAGIEMSAAALDIEQRSAGAGTDYLHVRSALSRLEPAQRELLELAFYSGWTHPELAAHLGLPLGTVKTRIRAAIAKMRDLLRERIT